MSVPKVEVPSTGSDPEYAKRLAGDANKTDSVFYNDDISPKLTLKTRQILEDYSGIPSSEVVSHIHAIRERAWAIRAYPCIGSGIYLDPALPKHPAYPIILSRLQNAEESKFLEIGSFMGSDMRALVADGAPSTSLIATDIVSFWDVGYEMFRDKDRFECKFVQADMMDKTGPLRSFNHSVDIIHISKVMHQWSYERQVEACHRLIELSRPKSMIIGDQMGGESAHELMPYPDLPPLWMHDEGSWRKMWERVERETGTKWDVETQVRTINQMDWDEKDYFYLRDDARVLMFTMTRTA